MAAFSNSSLSDANTILALQEAAVSGQSHHIYGFEAVVEVVATAATPVVIAIKSSTTVLYQTTFVASAAVGTRIARDFTKPLVCTAGELAELNVTAGGTTNKMRGSFHGQTTAAVGTRGVG